MKKINIKEHIFNNLSGNDLIVTKEWLKVNDKALLRTLLGQYLDKVPDWITEEEVNNCEVQKFKLDFKEDRVIYSAVLKDKEEKLLIEKYEKLDWESHIIYLIKLDII